MTEQEWEDSEGNPPTLPAGRRVCVMPLNGEKGTVVVQKLHYDSGVSFFGNVIVKMDSGETINAHCWQCREVSDE